MVQFYRAVIPSLDCSEFFSTAMVKHVGRTDVIAGAIVCDNEQTTARRNRRVLFVYDCEVPTALAIIPANEISIFHL